MPTLGKLTDWRCRRWYYLIVAYILSIISFRSFLLLPDIIYIYVLWHPEYVQPQKSFDKPTEVINQDLYPSELRGVLAFLSKSHIIFIDSFFAAIALSNFSAKDIRFQISSEITLSYG